MSGTITFAATGIERTIGGVASANRNVLTALRRLAASYDARLIVRVLHEPKALSDEMFCYNSDRARFAMGVMGDLVRSRLTIFDHVHLARLALLVPKTFRSQVVICAHGSEVSRRLDAAGMASLLQADLVLTNSSVTLQRMRATLGSFTGNICMLGLPPQFTLTAAPPERDAERPVLLPASGSARAIGNRAMLLVGRMDAGEREKGHRELIAILPRIREKVPEAELVFVGGGSDAPAIAEAAAASPAASHIFLPGRVSDAELAALYLAAYAYVMPSRQEGFGLVYLEAMNQALPCLACSEDGAADVVINGETGVLVNQPLDERELTAAVVALLSDPIRARAQGIAGWRRLNKHFTATAHQARVEAALEPLLA